MCLHTSDLIEKVSSHPHMSLIIDQSTFMQGVNINLHSSSLVLQQVSSPSLLYILTLFRSIFISPDEDFLFEVETS